MSMQNEPSRAAMEVAGEMCNRHRECHDIFNSNDCVVRQKGLIKLAGVIDTAMQPEREAAEKMAEVLRNIGPVPSIEWKIRIEEALAAHEVTKK